MEGMRGASLGGSGAAGAMNLHHSEADFRSRDTAKTSHAALPRPGGPGDLGPAGASWLLGWLVSADDYLSR